MPRIGENCRFSIFCAAYRGRKGVCRVNVCDQCGGAGYDHLAQRISSPWKGRVHPLVRGARMARHHVWNFHNPRLSIAPSGTGSALPLDAHSGVFRCHSTFTLMLASAVPCTSKICSSPVSKPKLRTELDPSATDARFLKATGEFLAEGNDRGRRLSEAFFIEAANVARTSFVQVGRDLDEYLRLAGPHWDANVIVS